MTDYIVGLFLNVLKHPGLYLDQLLDWYMYVCTYVHVCGIIYVLHYVCP